MAIELRQQLRLTQQLVMTPQLQMAIKLLQLSRLELLDTIRQELEENPALEEIQEADADFQGDEASDAEGDSASDFKEVSIEERTPDIDWSNYIEEYNSPESYGKVHFESEEREAPAYDNFLAKKESLYDHLLWQLLMTSPTKEEERIGSLIIGNLDKHGYLQLEVEEIARLGESRVEKVELVLSLMQTFDPSGVCARNLSECLLIQARRLGLDDTVVTQIIQSHLPHLENRNYKGICKALKIDTDTLVAAINVIKCLEPRPGRPYTDEHVQYITPDIYIYKLEGEFVIVLNDDGMPKLRINNYYRNVVSKGEKISANARDYIQEKMRSAAWLIRSIHQRQKTIYRVMESILKFQEEFFDKGIAYLKPMVLRDVAQDIGMHESTISRVTTNKYAYTPQGIFELKYFFNSSISRIHGEAIASASVQDKIRQIIESENPKKPYSDSKIARMLSDANIDIARRTVAKYREMMGVLPSNKRKQI